MVIGGWVVFDCVWWIFYRFSNIFCNLLVFHGKNYFFSLRISILYEIYNSVAYYLRKGV